MVKFFREYWFGCVLGFMTISFLFLVVVIEQAPHNDPKMRGFTPCTYAMVDELSNHQNEMTRVMTAVGKGYLCYFGVMGEGFLSWVEGKQATPWDNYMFAIDSFEIDKKLSEPYSKDLLKSNRLN